MKYPLTMAEQGPILRAGNKKGGAIDQQNPRTVSAGAFDAAQKKKKSGGSAYSKRIKGATPPGCNPTRPSKVSGQSRSKPESDQRSHVRLPESRVFRKVGQSGLRPPQSSNSLEDEK